MIGRVHWISNMTPPLPQGFVPLPQQLNLTKERTNNSDLLMVVIRCIYQVVHTIYERLRHQLMDLRGLLQIHLMDPSHETGKTMFQIITKGMS